MTCTNLTYVYNEVWDYHNDLVNIHYRRVHQMLIYNDIGHRFHYISLIMILVDHNHMVHSLVAK